MNTAEYVSALIAEQKAEGIPLSDVAWNAAKACVGWPYVFGAWGAYCTPAERRKRYEPAYPTIKSACQVLRDSNPKPGCDGCKWFPDGKRVRCFDCRGFTDWILNQIGIDLIGEGATSQWNTENNWVAKGKVKDGIPENTLVCLFYPKSNNSKRMAHTGLGYNGETVECSSGVQYSKTMNGKWTDWAVPVGIEKGEIVPAPAPDPETGSGMPILKRGSKGEYVSMLQTKLVAKGYDVGSCGIDGDFGSATLKAVTLFQKDHGLAADGIVGAETWKALCENTTNLYTVTIPHLTKFKAEGLVKDYAGSSMKEERG